MKSLGMWLKPKREYFCYSEHRIQFGLKEVLGLKVWWKFQFNFPSGKSSCFLYLWTVPSHSPFPALGGSSLGITILGTMEPFTAWAYAGVFVSVTQAGFQLIVIRRSSYTQWAVTEDSSSKRSLEASSVSIYLTSWFPQEAMESDGNHRHWTKNSALTPAAIRPLLPLFSHLENSLLLFLFNIPTQLSLSLFE